MKEIPPMRLEMVITGLSTGGAEMMLLKVLENVSIAIAFPHMSSR